MGTKGKASNKAQDLKGKVKEKVGSATGNKDLSVTRHKEGTTLPPRAWDHLVPIRAGRP